MIFAAKRTIYDVATGVIPSHRKQGIAKGIFQLTLPALRATKARQYILEAIEINQAAVVTYRSIGFEISRRFEVFRRES